VVSGLSQPSGCPVWPRASSALCAVAVRGWGRQVSGKVEQYKRRDLTSNCYEEARLAAFVEFHGGWSVCRREGTIELEDSLTCTGPKQRRNSSGILWHFTIASIHISGCIIQREGSVYRSCLTFAISANWSLRKPLFMVLRIPFLPPSWPQSSFITMEQRVPLLTLVLWHTLCPTLSLSPTFWFPLFLPDILALIDCLLF